MAKPSQPIRELMTPLVRTVDLETPLAEARKLMTSLDVRHLPVLDRESLVGVISRREVDLLAATAILDLEQLSVADAMADEPYVVPPETPVSEVAQTMADRKLGSAVVADGREVHGIFTTTDALAILARMLSRNTEV